MLRPSLFRIAFNGLSAQAVPTGQIRIKLHPMSKSLYKMTN